MSELTLFKSGASLPDYLRADPDEFTKRLAGGSTGKTISIKGGVWRMIVGGEEIAKNEDRAMNLVVVNAAPAVARTYYEGVYEEGAVTSVHGDRVHRPTTSGHSTKVSTTSRSDDGVTISSCECVSEDD